VTVTRAATPHKGDFFVAAATENTPKEFAPFCGAWGVAKPGANFDSSRMIVVEAIDATGAARVLLFFGRFLISPARPETLSPPATFYTMARITGRLLEFQTRWLNLLGVNSDGSMQWEITGNDGGVVFRNRYALPRISA
jgi:hypothetical protein